jgi:hypothetical protein
MRAFDMANFAYAVSYIYRKYPDKASLSEVRLQQMLYLADWKFAIEYGKRLTDIRWQIKDGKPFAGHQLLPYSSLSDFLERIKRHSFSSPGKFIKALERSIRTRVQLFYSVDKMLIANKKKVLNFVIEKSISRTLDDLIQLVCSTYPLLGEHSKEDLDLIEVAKTYNDKVRPILKALPMPN